MAHERGELLVDPVEQTRAAVPFDGSVAEFVLPHILDLTAENVGEQLVTVADTECGETGLDGLAGPRFQPSDPVPVPVDGGERAGHDERVVSEVVRKFAVEAVKLHHVRVEFATEVPPRRFGLPGGVQQGNTWPFHGLPDASGARAVGPHRCRRLRLAVQNRSVSRH